jgi:antitoxin component YwqK of YwqJK toxin-antitoxin module
MSKFETFNSPELNCIKDIFNQLHHLQLDVNLAYIVESYIYKWIEEIHKKGYIIYRYRIKFGEKDGEYKGYYKDGNIFIQKSFINGILNGECIKYYPNGKIFIQKSYINGNLNGEYKEYYKNGEKYEQKYYLDGQLNGTYTTWSSRGLLYSERIFIKDKLQQYKRWNEYGIITDHIIYKNGKEINLNPNNN